MKLLHKSVFTLTLIFPMLAFSLVRDKIVQVNGENLTNDTIQTQEVAGPYWAQGLMMHLLPGGKGIGTLTPDASDCINTWDFSIGGIFYNC